MAVLTHKSLAGQSHELSEVDRQLELLKQASLAPFQDKLAESNLFPLTVTNRGCIPDQCW